MKSKDKTVDLILHNLVGSGNQYFDMEKYTEAKQSIWQLIEKELDKFITDDKKFWSGGVIECKDSLRTLILGGE